MEKAGILIVAFIFCFAGHARSQKNKEPEKVTTGRASYYAKKFQGRKTANGEEFNNYDYTAAHRKLPFHTYLNVINKNNNFNIIVRVNDRGPYSHNRLIDLSEAAARRIGAYQAGLVPIKIEVLDLVRLTPALEQRYTAAPVVDCFGNPCDLSALSLSLWFTDDLVHAIYVANDLYLKENVSQVMIGIKEKKGKCIYHIVITGIDGKVNAEKLKDEYEKKGFMKVSLFEI